MSEATKHTPGPWKVVEIDHATKIVAPNRKWAVCGHMNATDEDAGELAANARLIAAAPDLLAALVACDVSMDAAVALGIGDILPPAYRDSWARAHTAARAAIAKLKGGGA